MRAFFICSKPIVTAFSLLVLSLSACTNITSREDIYPGSVSENSQNAIFGEFDNRCSKPKAAYFSLSDNESGFLFIWEDVKERVFSGQVLPSPLKGKSGCLWPCILMAFNFSSDFVSIANLDSWDFHVMFEGRSFPLQPLSVFVEEFHHPGTLFLHR